MTIEKCPLCDSQDLKVVRIQHDGTMVFCHNCLEFREVEET